MSFFRDNENPQEKSILKQPAKETPLIKPEIKLDPESKEFSDTAIWEKGELGKKIQKLQIAKEVLMRLVVGKDSDGRDSEITTDSKLSDIIIYIDEELDAALKERDIL